MCGMYRYPGARGGLPQRLPSSRRRTSRWEARLDPEKGSAQTVYLGEDTLVTARSRHLAPLKPPATLPGVLPAAPPPPQPWR